MREVEAARQRAIHIIVTVAPPFVGSACIGIVINHTHKRAPFETNREGTSPSWRRENVIFGIILMHCIALVDTIAINRILGIVISKRVLRVAQGSLVKA